MGVEGKGRLKMGAMTSLGETFDMSQGTAQLRVAFDTNYDPERDFIEGSIRGDKTSREQFDKNLVQESQL